MKRTGRFGWAAALVLLAVGLGLSLPAAAQNRGGGGPGGGGREGGREGGRDRGRRRFDPEQMRAMMMDRMKTMLEVGDEEWPAIEPLLSDVMAKQREARGGMGRRMWGRRGGEEQDQPKETAELQAVLDKPNATSEEIKAKLTSYRAAQKVKEAELQAAREKLRAVLTIKQEARLVMMGTLD